LAVERVDVRHCDALIEGRQSLFLAGEVEQADRSVRLVPWRSRRVISTGTDALRSQVRTHGSSRCSRVVDLSATPGARPTAKVISVG
jgi:hypothetical protein